MELEYKWDLAGGETLEALRAEPEIAGLCTGQEDIAMDAVYYDTADGLFTAMRGALRLRRENETSVCCMKAERTARGGLQVREEYEVPATEIREGLEKLPAAGAPEDLCRRALASELVELCRISFLRTSLTLSLEEQGRKAVVELDFDRGESRRQNRTVPIREVELEFKDGDQGLFSAFAERLERRFGLQVQQKSKLARAMGL